MNLEGLPTKILFLDVDGVLNSLDWFTAPPQKLMSTVDPVAVKRIQRVCEATGARIVLSSSWRHSPELIGILHASGVPWIYDSTPRIDNADRSLEIVSWLYKHPEVTNYAIVDDDPDAASGSSNLGARFVRTYFKHGLYGKHERALVAL